MSLADKVQGTEELHTLAERSPEGVADLHQVSGRAFRSGDRFYVRSSSTHGKFYEVVTGTCSCPGFAYRHMCQHVTHLEKLGYLVHDIKNGSWKVAKGGNPMAAAEKVTTGIRHPLAGAPDEVEVLGAQVRRLQNLARAQRAVIMHHQRVNRALSTGHDAGFKRGMISLERSEKVLANREAEMLQGDLVELADE